MSALLIKDIRLSFDVLRPWALLLVTFALGILAISYLPPSLLPGNMRLMSVAELFTVIGPMVAMSSIAVSAWTTASIVQGDARHGAAFLAGALPIRPWRRLTSKLFVIVIAALIPVAIGAGMYAIGLSLLHSNYVGAIVGRTLVGGLIASSIGVAFSLVVASSVRGVFRATAISLLYAGVAAAAGGAGAWIGFQIAGRSIIAIYRNSAAQTEFTAVLDRAMLLGGGSGLLVAALACAIVGARRVVRIARPNSMLRTVVATLTLAAVVGTIAAKPLIDTDPTLARSAVYATVLANHASDDEICAAIARRGPYPSTDDRSELEYRLLLEAQRRVTALPLASRAGHPIARALRAKEDFSTAEAAGDSLWWLVPRDDPRRLALALDAVARFQRTDRSEALESLLINERELSVDWTAHPPPQREAYADRDAHLHAYYAWQRDRLREGLTNAIAANHPERERMQRVLDALSSRPPE